MLPFLLIVSALLAVIDAALTYERVGRYGLGIELNRPLARAMQAFGRLPGLIVAQGVPNLIVLVALALASADHLAAFWCGLKVALFLLQLKSLALEAEVRELAGRTTRSAL